MTGSHGRIGRGLGGFGAVLAVQTVVGLVQTAGLLRAVGPSAWGAVNVAQAAGLLGTTVVTAGLGSFGAATLALREPMEQPGIFLAGVRARVLLFLGVSGVLAVGAVLLRPQDAAAVTMVAVGALSAGLGASWYFIARGEPARWLVTEVVPLGCGTVLGVVAALWTGSVTTFAALFMAGGAAAVVRAWSAVRADRRDGPSPSPTPLREYLRENRPFLTAGVAGGVNGYGPALLLAATAAPQVPTFLLLDRMVKYVVAGASPALQVAQRWVPAGEAAHRRSRGLRVLALAAVSAVLAGAAFALLADPVARVLSSGAVRVGHSEAGVFAALVAVLLVTQVNALAVLVALDGARTLARSTAAGAVILLLAGGAAGAAGGPAAVVWTVLVVEAGILAVQVRAVVRSRPETRGEASRRSDR